MALGRRWPGHGRGGLQPALAMRALRWWRFALTVEANLRVNR
jgi:hypothetical protein